MTYNEKTAQLTEALLQRCEELAEIEKRIEPNALSHFIDNVKQAAARLREHQQRLV